MQAARHRVGLAEHLRLERSPAWPPRTDWFLRAESFFNVATEVDELGPELLDAYGGRSLHAQSHGESFLALAVHRFGPRGLYVLDEPEAALSPQGQLAFLQRLSELAEDACQLVVATHSPLLLAFPGARILGARPTTGSTRWPTRTPSWSRSTARSCATRSATCGFLRG